MKQRGKALQIYTNDMDFHSSASQFTCNKHPSSSSSSSSSSIGICPHCLKDRLLKLICSDCGEQRLSSCSCSEISSNRNSSSVDVGTVGRVSFLIENDNNGVSLFDSINPKMEEQEEILEIKKTGFWKIGSFFKKKREKGCGFDQKTDLCMIDQMAVSRSRSLCSFRGGGGVLGSEDGGDMVVSGGRSSISGARTSSVNGGGFICDSARRSGFSETEQRKSGFDSDNRDCDFINRRVFSLRETDFNGMDESGFIDFKLDFTSEIKPESSVSKMGLSPLSNPNSAFGSTAAVHECGRGSYGGAAVEGRIGGVGGGGSCRITVSERGIMKGRKSLKAWKWMFKHQPNWGNGTGLKNKEKK